MEEMNLEAFKLYNLSIAFSKTKTHTGSEIWLLTCSRRPSRRLRMYSLPVVPSHSGAPLPLFLKLLGFWIPTYYVLFEQKLLQFNHTQAIPS